MNDPNGLILHEGRWHLFFQHNPAADTWGPMHWGHAVSDDLVRWEPCPTALAPDEHGTVFSGSTVLDRAGTAGFGRGAIVAVFTYDAPGGQAQAIAGSVDGGQTWRKHPANPVLRDDRGGPEFRDPRVLRWVAGTPGDAGERRWVMVLACGRELRFYHSRDLVAWSLAWTWQCPESDEGILETPDLFRASTADGESRWVLAYGILDRRPGGRSGTRYLVGDFDGQRFEPLDGVPRWADLGPDFYAAQTWTGSAEPVWVGWLSNWAYAAEMPSDGWRGTMSIPRALTLVRTRDGLRLAQAPVAALAEERSRLCDERDLALAPGNELTLDAPSGALELRLVLDPLDAADLERACLRIEVREGEDEELRLVAALVLEVEEPGRVALAMTRSPMPHLSRAAGDAWIAPAAAVADVDGPIEVRILLDATSLEVFAGSHAVSTGLPGSDQRRRIVLMPAGGTRRISGLEAFVLRGRDEAVTVVPDRT